MGKMIVRGTTPAVTLTCSDSTIDLRLLGTPMVSIEQDGRTVEFTGITASEHALSFCMTQEQTLSLDAGTDGRPKAARIQCHFIKNGKRTESFIVPVAVYDTLHEGVI